MGVNLASSGGRCSRHETKPLAPNLRRRRSESAWSTQLKLATGMLRALSKYIFTRLEGRCSPRGRAMAMEIGANRIEVSIDAR